MNIVPKATCLLGVLLAAAIPSMADITWTLQDVTFTNGNQATGFFTTNDAITAIQNFSITVSGPASSAAFVAVQMVDAYLPSTIGLANADFSEYVDLYLASPLTSAGGLIPLTGGFDCPGCGALIVNPDTAVVAASATPEPTTWALLSAGILLVGFTARRRLAIA